MRTLAYKFCLILLLYAISINNALAGAEFVYVFKVINDNAIIVRKNGNAYLIKKGFGCLSLWQYEGKKVLIYSPGLFLGIGSKLLIPELNQNCRIWDSKYLGSFDDFIKHKLSTNKKFDDSDCQNTHWIKSISDDGSIIILEDGSVWQVDDIDQIYSALWLPIEEVIVCKGFMINLDNNEKVRVVRLK